MEAAWGVDGTAMREEFGLSIFVVLLGAPGDRCAAEGFITRENGAEGEFAMLVSVELDVTKGEGVGLVCAGDTFVLVEGAVGLGLGVFATVEASV